MRILVTGATGLVGQRLVKALVARGDQVLALTRRPAEQSPFQPPVEHLQGDPAVRGAWLDEVPRCDAFVHLAGENIFGKRWSKRVKAAIWDSRIRSTGILAEALREHPRRADGTPRVLLSGSAVGYYGPRDETPLAEDAPAGDDFMARLCVDWEAAADPARRAGVRVAHPRLGLVLDSEGGMLATLLPPFKMYVGGPVGSGKQYMSWIHHQDLTRLLLWLLDSPEVHGPVNATAPEPVTNEEFSRILASVLGKPSWFRTPGFALRLGLGEIAEIITQGQRVIPTKALSAGFSFQFPILEPALRDLLVGNPTGA